MTLCLHVYLDSMVILFGLVSGGFVRLSVKASPQASPLFKQELSDFNENFSVVRATIFLKILECLRRQIK